MADPDGNPPGSSDPMPAPPPAQAKPVAPAPRSNPPNINAGKEKAAPAGPPGFNDFVEWMRTMSGDAPTADQRNLIPKERKKFQRQDTEARADKSVPAAPDASDAPAIPSVELASPATTTTTATTAAAPSSPPVQARPAPEATRPPAEPPSPRVRRGQQAATKRNFWLSVLVQGGVIAGFVLSFILGRASVKKIAPAPDAAPAAPEVTTQDGKTTTNVLSNANAALIDQAMAEIQEYHFKEATEALDKVKASGEHIRGLTLQRAQLAAFANEFTKAIPLLNEAIAEGDDLGEAYNLRATLSAKRAVGRNTNTDDYETASKLDPFDARIFFYWASTLRRLGKSQEAIQRFQQALDRLREPTLEGYYRLCIRLTQIELGQEKEFSDELARQLALPHPSIDWLFTAAALALRDGKYDAAASFLDRAEACGDPVGFDLRLRDYYFAQYGNRKELQRFFGKLVPPKAGRGQSLPQSEASPSPASSAAPLTGMDVPTLPPPTSPGATVAR